MRSLLSESLGIVILCNFMGYIDGENKCSANGDSFSYNEVLIPDETGGVTLRRISTNGCPNHYNNCQRDTCSGSSSNAEITLKTIDIPATPILISEGHLIDVSCVYGTVGIALNGVSIYSKRAKGSVCTDAIAAEGTTFDKCGGHSDPETHEYHYHIVPSCLLKQLNYTGTFYKQHSAQIGWSLDGFPIYGPTGPSGIPMVRCGICGADSTYCLDACNGYEGDLNGTNGYDGFLYRYYMTGDVTTTKCSGWVHGMGECEGHAGCCASTIPGLIYNPYTISCYRGCPLDNTDCALNNHTLGTVSDYVPTLSNFPCESEGHDQSHYIAPDEIDTSQPSAVSGFLLFIVSLLSFVLCLLLGFLLYLSRRRRQVTSAGWGNFLGLSTESGHGCVTLAEDYSCLEISRRSDESNGSGTPLDEIAVTFDDNSSGIFGCVEHVEDCAVPVGRMQMPCMDRPGTGKENGNEGDDTPWAI
eukprot:gene4938-9856_t